MTEEEFHAAVKAVDRRYFREMLAIHAWAFVQINLIIFGLMGALWLLHRVIWG